MEKKLLKFQISGRRPTARLPLRAKYTPPIRAQAHNRSTERVPVGPALGLALAGLLFAGLAVVTTGCGGDRLTTAHVEGKVLYNGTPLKFGSVLFQPDKGPIAKGIIQDDGTFVMSTYKEGDGATIGTHKVRIVCYDIPGGQAAAAHEGMRGRSLIPAKYARAETSGLAVEVKAENEPLTFNLVD